MLKYKKIPYVNINRLKRFDKSSFKSRKVERSTSSGKDKEFGVNVLPASIRAFQKRERERSVYLHQTFSINYR